MPRGVKLPEAHQDSNNLFHQKIHNPFTMKKIKYYNLLFIVFLFVTNKIVSQQTSEPGLRCSDKLFYGLYLSGNAPAGRVYIGSNETSDNATNTYTDEVVNGSYGRGFYLAGSIGYPVCPRFAFDLDAYYFHGCSYTFTDHYNGSFFSSSDILRSSGMGIGFRPSGIIYGNTHNRITPYAQIGLVLPFMMMTNRTTQTFTNNQTHITDEYTSKESITPKFTLGAFGGMGVNYQFKNSWGLTAGLEVQTESFTPKRGVLKSYTEDGIDKLSTLNESQKKTDYVNSISYSNAPSDSTKPSKRFGEPQPFSFFGFHIGITYNLGKGAAKKPTEETHVANVAPPAPPVVKPQPCVCSNLSVKNNAASNPVRTLKMDKNFDKATKNYSFKITVITNVDLTCGASTEATPCSGTFITEIYAGGGTAGFKKVYSTACSTTTTFADTAVSFYGSSSSSSGLDKVSANVKITFISICNGQMKRITQTMEIMSGDLVNSKWGAWENVGNDEAKEIEKSYEKK